MSRPSKLTPERVKRITDALQAGATRRNSALVAGIDEATFCRWLRRSADFASSVTQAEASCELAAVATITQAARAGDWRAALTWLERRRHADWARRDYLEIEVRQAAEAVAEQIGADPTWLIERAQQIAAAAQLQHREA